MTYTNPLVPISRLEKLVEMARSQNEMPNRLRGKSHSIKYFPVSKVTSAHLKMGPWNWMPDESLTGQEAKPAHEDLLQGMRVLASTAKPTYGPKGLGVTQGSGANIKTDELILLVGNDMIQWLLSEKKVYHFLEPVAAHELVLAGYFGKLGKIHVVTDAYLPPQHKLVPRRGFTVFMAHLDYFDTFEPQPVPSEPDVSDRPWLEKL